MKINVVARLKATDPRVLASFEIDAAWWDTLSRERQELYLKKHPRSKYGKGQKNTSEKETSTKPKAPAADTVSTKPVKGKAAHKAASVSLNPEETQAIKEYTGSMYQTVNPRLRAGKPVSVADRKEMKLVDKAFERASTTEPIEVYRGIGSSSKDMYANLKVGESFKDEGFVSTSTDKDSADNFSRGDTPTMMHIQVPKGSKAISVDSLSVFKKGGAAVRSENEILLNRGGSYKVLSIKPGKRGQPRIITVEYTG